LVRADIEPYTDYDFFITVANDCERFASQNARYNPDCSNHVLQYADGQSLIGQDLVVWYRVSFHHVPRDEDQGNMHSHWDGFIVEPFNRAPSTPELNSANNTPPELLPVDDQINVVGDDVHAHLEATDSENDRLVFTATGLPPGLSISTSGSIEGTLSTVGEYSVIAQVNDELSVQETRFNWTVAAATVIPPEDGIDSGATDNATDRRSGGGLTLFSVLALLSLTAVKWCRRLARQHS